MEIKIDSAISELHTALAVAVKELNTKAAEAARQHKLAFKAFDWDRAAELIRQIKAKIQADTVKLSVAARKFKAGLPGKLRTLAMNGWFIYGFRTPSRVIYPIASSFEAGRLDEANKAMCWHFDKVAPDIEADLSKRFSNRASILKKAFEAHKAGNYELSIPVFLAQADGIGREALGKNIPSIYTQRPDKKAKIREAIHLFESEAVLGSEFLDMLLIKMPLNASENDTALLGRGVINRNEILHGTNTDYASFLNSCRAISWLDYVAYFHKLSSRKKFKSISKAG
jgi:hypothetical protein